MGRFEGSGYGAGAGEIQTLLTRFSETHPVPERPCIPAPPFIQPYKGMYGHGC